jgi:hypothetical protein
MILSNVLVLSNFAAQEAASSEPSWLLTILIPATISFICSIIVFSLGVWTTRLQYSEAIFRNDPSLNIEVHAEIIASERRDCHGGERILEVRVKIVNNCRRACAIPAAYIQARSLLGSSRRQYRGQISFKQLEICDSLSKPVNSAYINNSIVQVSPDEIESFVRWDTLTEDFINTNRVLVVNVEVFATLFEHLGERHFPRFRRGRLRADWIAFMASDNEVRLHEIPFARYDPKVQGVIAGLRPYQRYLTLPGTLGEVDFENTRRFQPVLETMVQWTRHVTIDLRAVA